ncbi:hypothetical protein Tco_0956233, partial [Tanacetum coccineum]
MFKTYTAASEDKKVLLGDYHTTNVAGIENVELKVTSRKTVILKYVMQTLEIRKNLVSSYLLNKAGYAFNSKAYRFFDLNSHVILESNDANFYEHKYPFKSTNSGGASSSNLPLIRMNENNDDLDSEPRINVDMWQEAINDEMESLESNRTLHLVDLPPGCKMIG